MFNLQETARIVLAYNWNQKPINTLQPRTSLSTALHNDARNPYTLWAAEQKLASTVSALLLETQLNSIPQSMTGQPKSNRRFYYDAVIPMPTALTLPAWQSVCHIGGGTVPFEVGATRFMFWTCFMVPTLADPNRSVSEDRSLPPGHAVVMREGYGMFDVVLALWSHSIGWKVTHSTKFDQDVSVPAYELMFAMLKESDFVRGNAHDWTRATINHWKGYDPHSDWNPCPLYASMVTPAHNTAATVWSAPWGIHADDPATSQFERLLREHGVGFRFGSTLALGPWVDAYLDAYLTQMYWYLGPASKRGEILAKLDMQLKAWHDRYGSPLGELNLDMESIVQRLGL